MTRKKEEKGDNSSTYDNLHDDFRGNNVVVGDDVRHTDPSTCANTTTSFNLSKYSRN